MIDQMKFSIEIKRGIERIREIDQAVQDEFINIICNDVRNINPDVIKRMNAFYVPNDDYMINMFGPLIKGFDFDCYNLDGTCKWLNYLLFPITDLANTIVGFAGFNPHNYLLSKEQNDKSLNYYGYSSKHVFQKGNYLFGIEGTYKKALADGYLIITDGLFDCLSLESYGYNSMALLGSFVSDQVLSQLIFIKKIIVAHDNDEAGIKLANFLKSRLDNVMCVKQKYTKDVDGILKTSYRDQYLAMLNGIIHNNQFPMRMDCFSK